jgi:anti-anti-sigma regulatory factor
MSVVAESNLDAGSTLGSGPTLGVGPEPAHRLELRVQPGDDCTVVQVWGELYTSKLGELARLLDGLVRAGRTRILLDLSRLYDLDGDAISELGRWRNALAASGGWLWLAAPRPWVRRLLEHMCLRGTFTVFPSVTEARKEFAARARI